MKQFSVQLENEKWVKVKALNFYEAVEQVKKKWPNQQPKRMFEF